MTDVLRPNTRPEFLPVGAAAPGADPEEVRAAAARASWRGVLREVLGEPPLRVLHPGAGAGGVALLLDAMGHYVHGVEADPALVRRARAKSAQTCAVAQFHEGPPDDLEFRAGVFDAVHARDVLARVREPQVALLEWYRVLRRGGIVFVAETGRRPDPAHALRAAGFTEVRGVDVDIARACTVRRFGAEPWYRRWPAARRRYRLAWGLRP